jgi:O-antigen/teichoic acid export membrane protein
MERLAVALYNPTEAAVPEGLLTVSPSPPRRADHDPDLPANGNKAQPIVSGFRATILRAATWSLGGYVAIQVLRVASSLVLTRLLVPEMFGIMAIATLVQVAVTMLSDVGLRPAAIQSPLGDRERYLNTAWTLQVAHGILIWLVCVAIAAGIAAADGGGFFPQGSVYADPVLPWIIGASAFATVIGGFQSTRIITAYRNLALGRITAIELTAQSIGLCVAVVLAWQTKSIWSFVISAWCSALVSTIASFVFLSGHQSRLTLDKAAVADLVRFGKWILLSSAFTVLAANGDRLLFAGWITPLMLGLYVLAFNLITMVDGAGSHLFSTVAMPTLSKINREEPERLRTLFIRLRLPFDLAFLGAAGAIFMIGPSLIGVLYDERYAGASTALQILSFSLVFARYGMFATVYLAVGRPELLTLYNLVRVISLFAFVPIGYALHDFEGAVWATALHGAPAALLFWFLNTSLRLNSMRVEALVSLAWPAGCLAGWLGAAVLSRLM